MVYSFGSTEKTTLPPTALTTVITTNAPHDPIKTTNLLYFMAKIMAKKKVLSPISHTKMVRKEVVNEVNKLS